MTLSVFICFRKDLLDLLHTSITLKARMLPKGLFTSPISLLIKSLKSSSRILNKKKMDKVLNGLLLP